MNAPQLIHSFPVHGHVGSFQVFNATSNTAMHVLVRGWLPVCVGGSFSGDHSSRRWVAG